MLISCEKCATTYVLDERLIPAAGAPVQCTRCGHVFTARAGAPASATVPVAPAAAPLGSTPSNQTMMFGAAGAPAPKAPPTNQTMMFGAAPAAPPKAPAPNQTMMFGVAAAPAPPKASQTTVMFGAVPAAVAAAAPPPKAAPAAPAANRSTMMFGAVANPPAAPAPAAPPAASASNRTMMFGAVPPAAAPPPASASGRTMVFGAVPPQANPPAPAPPAPASKTMMFGAPTAENPNVVPRPPPAAGRNVVLGDSDLEGAPRPNEQTVRVDINEIERMARAEAKEAGGDGDSAIAERGHREKTQLFAMSQEHQPEAATPTEGTDAVMARHNKTAMFAMSPEPAAPAPAPIGRPKPAPREPAPELAAEPKSNVKFDPSLVTTLPPDGSSLGPPPTRATMIFGASPNAIPPPMATPMPMSTPVPPPQLTPSPLYDAPLAGDLANSTLPNLPQLAMEQPLNLPPLGIQPASSSTLPDDVQGEDPAQALKAQVKRRNRLALVVVVLALLAAAGAVAWRVVGPKLFGHAVPVQAMQSVEVALSQLKRDDASSKAAAVTNLEQIVATYPGFVDARAGLVTALTLQLDDLHQGAMRLFDDQAVLQRKIETYRHDKSPANWEALSNELIAKVGVIKKDYDPLLAEAEQLEGKLRAAFKAMETAVATETPNHQAELAAMRARALYQSYKGSDEALKLSARYRDQAKEQADNWIELVDAEYAVNSKASPELVESALGQLKAARSKDSTFFRTFVLEARLQIQAHRLDEAEAALENLVAMMPKHEVANDLLAWVKKARASPKKPLPELPEVAP